MKTYTITSGIFRMDDGTLRGVDETIDLDDDIAEACKHQLQEVQPEADAGDESPEA